MQKFLINTWLPYFIFIALLPLTSFSASRTVYFSQSGNSVTRNGVSADATKISCTINLVNQSSISQTYTMTFNPVTPVATGTVGAGAATWNGSAGTSTGTKNSATALAAGATHTFIWTYPSFTAAAVGTQNVICAGSITVTDPGTNPGFVSASGTLVTFVESGQMESTGVTGAALFGGQAVYLQTPILINRGRPF